MFVWRSIAVVVGLSLGPMAEWLFPHLDAGFDEWTIARASAISMVGYLLAIGFTGWLERRLYPDSGRSTTLYTGL